jgi:putative ABC transport system permease protein
MLHDFRYAYRLLKKTPLATSLMVLALALGIGTNVGSYNIFDALLLHPFRYPNVDRILHVWETLPRLDLQYGGVSPRDFADFQEQSRSFEQLAAYRPWPVNLTGGDRPERVNGAKVTAGFFRVFGAAAKLGRILADNESDLSVDRVAVLSESFWHARFASRPDIVGQTVALGGQNYTIVGVMADEFDYPLATEVWVPLNLSPSEKAGRDFRDLLVVGLLKKTVPIVEATQEMQALAKRFGEQFPSTNRDWSVSVTPLTQMSPDTEVSKQFIRVILIAGLFLLLLAGTNVAGIQLARSTSRIKTLAIESALGASRLRLARLLCVETTLVALAGGSLGIVAASWLNAVNRNSFPAFVYQIIPGLRFIGIDSRAVLFTLGLSLVTGVLCSVPALAHLLLKQSSTLLGTVISQGNRTLAGSRRSRLRHILVTCEVAGALLLLVGAGVMMNTFQHMVKLNLGFNPSNLLTAEISLPKLQYPGNPQVRAFFDRVLPDLTALPNVRSASMEGGMGEAVGFVAEGRVDSVTAENKPDIRVVGTNYFGTMQLPILRGRVIGDEDGPSTAPVAIISESAAKRYFGGVDPIGRRIHFNVGTEPPWYTVVGVCGDTMQWFTNTPEPAIYISYRQAPTLSLVARTTTVFCAPQGILLLLSPVWLRAFERRIPPSRSIRCRPWNRAFAIKGRVSRAAREF